MKNLYSVTMTHTMRTTVSVFAANEEEARRIAYAQAFEEEDVVWEEIDTTYKDVSLIGTFYQESEEEEDE